VITPYALQAREIRQRVSAVAARRDARHIVCSTIHRFQGQESDVVIIDMVDAAPMRPGILLTERGPGSSARNLLNVSLSRARGKLILVADVDYFERNAPDSIVAETLRCAARKGRRVRRAGREARGG
jgi:superfamily I DNA and/or RNA helicase